ncbi:hypothetical protein [Spiroplasma endosymbiont of 'Nebria riversi']|uniref:hypothetical protein n=1 Tax=Spiroplasma endosymbiont of 'Nebria riversi' TaxID=2792084 RepID=UPI001C041CE9|nr:hypothetical protein [Spiroplasma endosymbiont of 'Nebria riversi']
MRKFLSALNLICIMLTFGCSKNSNVLKTYKLQFSKISKSAWISSNFLYRPQYLEIDASDLNIPNYLNEQVSHNGKFTIRNTEQNSVIGFAFYLLVDVRSNVYNQLGDFYLNNSTRKSAFSKDFYVIDTLVDVKISIHKLEDGFYLTSFSAEVPNKKN